MSKWLAVLGVSALVTMALLAGVKLMGPTKTQSAEAFAEKGVDQKFEPLWHVPDFSYVDQHNVAFTPQRLAGKVWVANFVFTQCRTICPLLTAKMVQLQRKLPGVDVSFVSFSVDPAHDTPEVLADYAKRWAAEEQRWTLVATDARTLPVTARGFHVMAKQAAPGDVDPIIHSGVFVLVDREGFVRGVFDSELRSDFEALERGVRLLTETTTPMQVLHEPTDPEALYHALGCANCHERAELAPSLAGRAGQKRELENGLIATYDAAYVKEAVLAPEVKRVRGFPLRMPTYEGLISPAGLEALTAWLMTRPADAAPEPEAQVAVDPVCQMKVRVTENALHAEVDGGVVYFCSEHCRTRFVANPAAFAR